MLMCIQFSSSTMFARKCGGGAELYYQLIDGELARDPGIRQLHRSGYRQ